MRYLLIVLAVLSSAMVAVPVFAQAGVQITLTTTITGGGSSGFDSGGSVPYKQPDWVSMFPSMNQPQSSATGGYTPQPTYIPLPDVPKTTSLQPQSESVTQSQGEYPKPLDSSIIAAIVFGSIGIGLIVWAIYKITDKRREYE